MKLRAKLGAFFDRALNLFAILTGTIILFMMFLVSTEVVMRYFLNRPIVWMVEINEYALLYATFLGTAWVLQREGHIRVELVVKQLRPRVQAMVGVITSFLGAIVCGGLVWYSAQSTWDHYVRGVFNPGHILETPTAFVLAVMPVGAFLLSIQFLRRTSGYLGRWRTLSSKE